MRFCEKVLSIENMTVYFDGEPDIDYLFSGLTTQKIEKIEKIIFI
jgi:hypothetical protein